VRRMNAHLTGLANFRLKKIPQSAGVSIYFSVTDF
jgi:hypothetical protein